VIIVKKNHLRLTKGEIKYFRLICHNSKSLYNRTLFLTRKHYENCGKFLNYLDAYKLIKDEKVYHNLPSCVAQQTMKIVERDYRSFFGLLKKKQQGIYGNKINIPHYKPKDGYYNLIFPVVRTRDKDNFKLIIPKRLRNKFNFKKITISIPNYIKGKTLKEVRILPKLNATYFEIEWVYEQEPEIQNDLNKERTASIDPGVDNFATMLDSKSGRSFILDGKKLKSYNRYYNKKKAKLQSILNKQKKKSSKRISRLGLKRKNVFNDALNQYVNFIIKYCLKYKVGNIVIGEGHLAQENSSLGKTNNQNFINIPFGKFSQKLESKCQRYGIIFMTQEESYTSKCDHLAKESMQHHDKYIGKRIKRGLFKSSKNIIFNADVNGALGILIKSKHKVDLGQLVNSGCLTQPRRIRLENIRQTSSERLLEMFE
jgi:IS605 OrfB family transposase